MLVAPAVTIPAREAWLWKNKKALAMVMQGLKEAREGKAVPGPDLKADRAMRKKLGVRE